MKERKKQQQNKQKQQQHIITQLYNSGGDAISSCSEWSVDRAYIPCPTATIVKPHSNANSASTSRRWQQVS